MREGPGDPSGPARSRPGRTGVVGELVLLVTVAWLVSAVLIALLLGRAVRIADHHDRDAAFDLEVRSLIARAYSRPSGQAG